MAWRSTGRTNEELVNNLRTHNVISSDRVHSVMMAVDRGFFISHDPYEDRPQSIGYSATISAPHMHAYALNVLESRLQPGARALDVGSGSGFLTACFALMVGTNGLAVGIEHVEELTKLSTSNIQNWLNSRPMYNGSVVDLTLGKSIKLVTGDGRQGYLPHAPYDVIHVGAAAPTIPQALVAQLKPNGRLVCPVGPPGGNQVLYQVDKDPTGHHVTETALMGPRPDHKLVRRHSLSPSHNPLGVQTPRVVKIYKHKASPPLPQSNG
ncbi:hypothetical protein Aperf_G00000122977 [Anoplocephala perfoliata]